MKFNISSKKLKNKKLIGTFIIIPALVLSVSVPVFSGTSVQPWNLVDSFKHLDYDGNSMYMSQIRTGVSTWNAYKSGVIRPDSVLVIEDVFVRDVYKSDGNTGVTWSTGYIDMNDYYLQYNTSSEILNTATHELGHALGLDHNTSSDIMYKDQTTKTTLSANDKASYDEAYAGY